MIRITRTESPDILNVEPSEKKLYNKPEVVDALYEMQHKKCCYCERRIARRGLEKHVEHFRPREKYPELMNSWKNLLLACAQCNGQKSNQFPLSEAADAVDDKVTEAARDPLLLDPTSTSPDQDPEDHIEIIIDDAEPELFGQVKRRDGSNKGGATIGALKLYLLHYLKERRRHLRQLREAFLSIGEALDDDEHETARDRMQRILGKTSCKTQYAACTREFVRKYNLSEDWIEKAINGMNRLEDEPPAVR